MPHYNEICHLKDYEKKTTTTKQQKKAKTKTKLNVCKVPSSNIKLQSDKALTTQSYFFLTKRADGIFLNETS